MTSRQRLVNDLLIDWDQYDERKLRQVVTNLPIKIVRWIASIHPDNETRTRLLRLTGIAIGAGTVVNRGCVISDGYDRLLTLGERVAVSPNVTFICESGPNNSRLINDPYVREHLVVRLPVTVGDDAWIGSGAIVLPGSEIGHSVVVGAGAVVTGSIPSETVVAGVPARVIRRLHPSKG